MTFEKKVGTVAAIISLAALFFSVIQFLKVQTIEAKKPYLEKKLEWCEEAVETASKIANSSTVTEGDTARFQELYWGVMGMIEKDEVTQAMKAFGKGLTSAGGFESNKTEEQMRKLRLLSLELAHACREELSREWSASWAR